MVFHTQDMKSKEDTCYIWLNPKMDYKNSQFNEKATYSTVGSKIKVSK